MKLTLRCSLVSCVRAYTFHLALPGLKIIFGRWPDTLTSQRNFCFINPVFWPVKKLQKNELILMLFSLSECDCIFSKKQNLRFTGENWLFVQERLVNMTGEWSLWPVKTPLWLDIVRRTVVVLIPRCKEPFSYPFYAIKVLQWKVWMQKSFHK